MSLYPSLEDMKFDQMAKAQEKDFPAIPEINNMTQYNAPIVAQSSIDSSLYPSLGDFMGMHISEDAIAASIPDYQQIAIRQPPTLSLGNSQVVAPLSGQSLGLYKAQCTNGIRELILCKGKDEKVGLRVRAIDNGVFVCLVTDKSPAAIGGLRFGDQILQINGMIVAGFSMDKVHDMFRKAPVNGISVVVRDRPFERTVTLHKDSTGHVGFQFKNGKIVSLVKDSSAARNGLLTNHQMAEVDGQNVISLKDKEITKIIDKCKDIITVTIIPSVIYDHMIKKMSSSIMKSLMDHSIPTI